LESNLKAVEIMTSKSSRNLLLTSGAGIGEERARGEV